MLDKFKKLLGNTEPQEQLEQVIVEAVADNSNEVLAKLQADFDSYKAEADQLLTQATAEVAELKTKLEAANAVIAAAEQAKALAEKQTLETKMAARKEKIVAAIGTEKADGLMLATEALDDAAFNAVLSALAGSVEAEASTEMFKEVGVDAKAEAPKTDAVSRLAAALQAEINPQ